MCFEVELFTKKNAGRGEIIKLCRGVIKPKNNSPNEKNDEKPQDAQEVSTTSAHTSGPFFDGLDLAFGFFDVLLFPTDVDGGLNCITVRIGW